MATKEHSCHWTILLHSCISTSSITLKNEVSHAEVNQIPQFSLLWGGVIEKRPYAVHVSEGHSICYMKDANHLKTDQLKY